MGHCYVLQGGLIASMKRQVSTQFCLISRDLDVSLPKHVNKAYSCIALPVGKTVSVPRKQSIQMPNLVIRPSP
jgi:hypothetical protein